MKIKDIMFDLDGTLWDSSESVCKAWDNVLRRKNLPYKFTISDFEKVFGKTDHEIAAIMFSDLEPEEGLKLMNECVKEELEIIKENGGKLYNGILETLKELSKDYNLYIVSNCQKGYIESFLEYFDIGYLFTDFECAENTNLPKKDNIRLVKERNNIKDAVYVGDTMGDYEAALGSDTPFIHAAYGFGDIGDYKYSLYSFKNIKTVINQLEKDK